MLNINKTEIKECVAVVVFMVTVAIVALTIGELYIQITGWPNV